MHETGPAEGWRINIWPFPKPKPAPTPTPAPEPDVPEPTRAKWLRAWMALRQIDTSKLRVFFTFVPLTVFFAVSGIVAWLWLCLRAIWKFLKSVFS